MAYDEGLRILRIKQNMYGSILLYRFKWSTERSSARKFIDTFWRVPRYSGLEARYDNMEGSRSVKQTFKVLYTFCATTIADTTTITSSITATDVTTE